MAEIKKSHIKCGNCSTRFRSPIYFANTEAFETATMAGNTAQCPSCKKVINCNKENMSYVFADEKAGFVAHEFGKKDDA